MLNKSELELKKITIGAKNFAATLSFLSFICKCSVIVFLGYWFFDTLKVLGAYHPSSLNALAALVEKMSLGTVVHSIVTAGFSMAWIAERRGKKRAVRKLSELRHQVEMNDAYKASSQLDKNGHTPKSA